MAVIYMLLGLFSLVLLPIYVVLWAREGEGAFDRAMEAKGFGAAWGEVFILLWIAVGVSYVLAARWLRRLQGRGMWLAAVCAIYMLAGGLADTARADVGFGTVLLQYAFPLVALYAVVRHRRLFVA
ncbi:MAG: hypothetical protein ACYTF8_10135 [Planctomycetota bacterium]